MGLGCGMSCLRILLFAFNFMFWLLGIAVLAVGIWSRIDGNEEWDSLIKGNPQVSAANMMIAAGVIVSIIGFLGCCGAIKKSPCMLISYAILIFLIFAVELAAGIYAYTKRNSIQKELEEGLTSAMKESYGGDLKADKALTSAVDWFQKKMNCCGAGEPKDWKQSKWYNPKTRAKYPVPRSCCVIEETDCNRGGLDALIKNKKIFTKGCVPAVEDFIKSTISHMVKIGGACIAIAVIQLLGIVFACCLCHAIRENGGKSHA